MVFAYYFISTQQHIVSLFDFPPSVGFIFQCVLSGTAYAFLERALLVRVTDDGVLASNENPTKAHHELAGGRTNLPNSVMVVTGVFYHDNHRDIHVVAEQSSSGKQRFNHDSEVCVWHRGSSFAVDKRCKGAGNGNPSISFVGIPLGL